MLKHYLTVAFRNLWKYKNQNIIGIFCLSVGLLCFALCNYYTRFYFSYNSSISGSERMYILQTKIAQEVLSEQFPEIEKILKRSYSIQEDIEYNYEGEHFINKNMISFQDTSFIDFYSVQLIAGNLYTIKKSPSSIILSESKAKQMGFNDFNQLLGLEITDNSRTGVITGVFKDFPKNSVIDYLNDSFIFLNFQEETPPYSLLYAQDYQLLLKKGAATKKFEDKLNRYIATHSDLANSEEEPYLLTAYTTYYNWSDYTAKVAVFLFAFGLLILIPAFFNFVSFQISLIYNRHKNYAIRKVNGMNRIQLFGSVFSEFIVYFLLSCCITFILLEYILQFHVNDYYQLAYTPLIPSMLKIQLLKYSITGVGVLFVISLIITYIIDKINIHILFLGIWKKGKNIGHYTLLFIQLMILLVFLSTALVVKQQTDYTKNKLLSNLSKEEQEQIISVGCNFFQLLRNRDALINLLESSANIQATSVSQSSVIALWYRDNSQHIKGMDEQIVRDFPVSLSFFRFFHADLVQGKFMNDDSDVQSVVVNPSFVKLFPGENIIGKTFEYRYNLTYQVVGIIDNLQIIEYNVKNKENIMASMPMFFRMFNRGYDGNYYTLYVKAAPGKVKEAQEDIIRSMHDFIPETYEIETKTLKDTFDETFSDEKLLLAVSNIFFFFSLLIVLVSIYSSIVSSVEKRRKEVAIRKINGAGIKNIILLFGKSYFLLWSAVCLVGFPLVYYFANRWLETYTDKVSIHIGLFVGIYIFILLLIILTIIVQILKVARINPAKTLKTN